MNWTPYQITIILHHYYSVAEYPRSDAPIYQSTVDDLIKSGVLTESQVIKGEYGVTELGAALIKMWLETPLPVLKFVDPRTFGEAA